MQQIEGNIIDIHRREIYPGMITISPDGKIAAIERNTKNYDHYISPGFIDSHVHIESSMLTPQEFSKLAIRRGTVAIINDPHEIANVMGKEGVEFMMNDSKRSCIKTFFTIPSCVPATPFDCSGDIISSSDIEQMAKSGDFIGLSEMMNAPGVIYEDEEVLKKLEIARKYQLKIDGHAPGLSGADLGKYVHQGISTDHECVKLGEAEEKILAGMKILIRQGSAAKNYEALKPLISEYPDKVMFCTDDSHPNDLLSLGEIDQLVRRAVSDGFDLFDVLRIACYNPVLHYGIKVGTLKIGDPADFIKIRNLESFETLSVYIDGIQKYDVTKNDHPNRPELFNGIINRFNREPISVSDLKKTVHKNIIAIKVIPGEIVTERIDFEISSPVENLEADINRDILKIVYLNRYENKAPQIGFITGFQLKEGAFATSVSHDSHNIIAVGCSDQDIVDAVNGIIKEKGGITVKNNRGIKKLSLPIAGIMTNLDGEYVSRQWNELIREVKSMGCVFDSPFMTLSFMSLIIIPDLKIGERGLFEYHRFNFIDNPSD